MIKKNPHTSKNHHKIWELLCCPSKICFVAKLEIVLLCIMLSSSFQVGNFCMLLNFNWSCYTFWFPTSCLAPAGVWILLLVCSAWAGVEVHERITLGFSKSLMTTQIFCPVACSVTQQQERSWSLSFQNTWVDILYQLGMLWTEQTQPADWLGQSGSASFLACRMI